MKKYRIVNKFRFSLFIMTTIVVLVFIIGSTFGYFDARGVAAQEVTSVKVHSGDTLWDLAKVHGPVNTDTRRVVYEICQLNNVSADTLVPGMIIMIPKAI